MVAAPGRTLLSRWLAYLVVAGGAVVLPACSSSQATMAQKIASCQRLHGMRLSSGVTRSSSAAVWGGRTRQLIPALTALSNTYSASTDPVYYNSSPQVTLVQFCIWPPNGGTERTGYGQIAFTTVPGDRHWPGELFGDAYGDVVDTTCQTMKATYFGSGHSGGPTFSKVVTVARGGFANLGRPAVAGEDPSHFRSLQTWASYMSYTIQPGESVILHTAQESVAAAQCA